MNACVRMHECVQHSARLVARPIPSAWARAMVKCSLEYRRLETLLNENIKEPGAVWKHLDDYGLIAEYLQFYFACAVETRKLNPVGVTKVAKDLFKMPAHDATAWGGAVARAFNTCRKSCHKAATGVKLPNQVRELGKVMKLGELGCSEKKSPHSSQPGPSASCNEPVSQGLSDAKAEPSSPPPRKRLKTEATGKRELVHAISSPSQVLHLYNSRPVVKKEPVTVKQERGQVKHEAGPVKSQLSSDHQVLGECAFNASLMDLQYAARKLYKSGEVSKHAHTHIYIYIYTYTWRR